MLKFHYTKTFESIVIRLVTSLYRKSEVKRLKANYVLLVEILEHAIEQHKQGQNDKFIEAYLLLGNKLLIDIQSAKILTFLGLHGSAHAILAVILRTVRMMGALHLKSDLINEYLDEEKTSDRDADFRKKFSESSLQRVLAERFGKNERGEFANLDKALHGSSVGAKVYYARIRHNPNGTKGGDIVYDAFFEDEKSGAVINILNGAILDACGVYIERYQQDESLKNISDKYKNQIEIETKNLIQTAIKQEIRETQRKENKK